MKFKDRKCKCSHLKSEHHKTFWQRTYCDVCQCNEYLRYDKPTLFDKIAAGIGIGIVVILLSIVIFTYLFFSEVPEDALDKPLEGYTLGDFTHFVLMVLLLGLIVGFNISYDLLIRDWWVSRKRRTFTEP